ncbi:TPA: dynamin family protein [Campylobacter coli]|nr:dynamin family protein [Campylobacter coli]
MLEQQTKYIEFIDELEQNIKKINTLDSESFRLANLKEAIANVELLVPVIGAFSAGKSSLLNSFLNKKYLSVDVTPETALASELRFSQKEYIQAVKNDGSLVEFQIDDISSLKEQAHEYRYVRYFINQQVLKDIEPIILVDMPGFESPIDSHNKAILEYIEKGVFFVVLQSIENGNLTKTMINRIDEIRAYNRDFALFLSKTNLMPKDEALKVADKFKEQLKEYFNLDKTIHMVDDNGGESLQTIIKQINPNEIIKNLYECILREKFKDIKQTINASINALDNSKEENSQIIKELEESIQKLELEHKQMLIEVQNRYGAKGVDSIIESVTRVLSSNATEIAQTFIDNGSNSANALINELARTTLANSVRQTMQNISNDIITSLSVKLEDINKTMSNLTDNLNWTNALGVGTQMLAKVAPTALQSVATALIAKGGAMAILGKGLGMIVPVVGPILNVLSSILPALFSKSEEEKKQEQLEKIKGMILTQALPQVKGEIRSKLPEIFNAQVSDMIEKISNDFKEKINQKISVLQNTQAELDQKKEDIENTIKAYKEVLSHIDTLANKFIF